MSRGMTLVADKHLKDASGKIYDMIVLPGGGGGAKTFAASEPLLELLKGQQKLKRWYAAICASPAIVLAPNGLLPKRATCFPALHGKIKPLIENDPAKSRVVVDADTHCITSQGPGTTLEFAVTILRKLVGDEKADDVAKGLLLLETQIEASKL
eukprot:CAMPEP_0184493558 /NCGR_PEP_ID=MMETSP0113_2-20130426/26288_1 /TAXON_ID=91329 /ORGANISM="Norrisiella sphaerica, Strain BC52" /LENGTH=153 /DNA_ID=CAMNT_0026878855 /DNA_START=132 /DNA_END=593 /DNA_ORIENTATION=+